MLRPDTWPRGLLSPLLFDRDALKSAVEFVVGTSEALPGDFPGYSRYEAQLPFLAGTNRVGILTRWLTVITKQQGFPGWGILAA